MTLLGFNATVGSLICTLAEEHIHDRFDYFGRGIHDRFDYLLCMLLIIFVNYIRYQMSHRNLSDLND